MLNLKINLLSIYFLQRTIEYFEPILNEQHGPARNPCKQKKKGRFLVLCNLAGDDVQFPRLLVKYI